MIERPVRLMCTDKRTHPERELVVLVPTEPRPDLDTLQAMYGFEPVAAGEAPGILERKATRPETSSERRGFGAKGTMSVGEPSAGWRQIHKAEALVTDGTAGPVVHVPRCPTCGRAPRLGLTVLSTLAEQVPPDANGRVVVDISALPASYS